MKTIRRESRNVNLNRARLDKGQRCDEKNSNCCQDGKGSQDTSNSEVNWVRTAFAVYDVGGLEHSTDFDLYFTFSALPDTR
jgi:hypothetical protein